MRVPPPRSGAASVVLNDKLYVFGGFGGGSGRLDDFYSFDFAASTWDEIKPKIGGITTSATASATTSATTTPNKPGCRENNGLVVSGSGREIILFGGYNGNRWLNDLWSFDVTTNRWTCIQESLDTKQEQEQEQEQQSDVDVDHFNFTNNEIGAGGRVQLRRPCCRFGYVSATHNNKFILWGGFDGTDWLNDMYVFDFESSRWTEIEQFGTVPSRRSCPAWAKDERYIYLHGGYDGNERKDDFFSFCFDTCTWTQMPNRGSKPSPRYFHSCVLFDNKLITFGGYSGSRRLSDMHTYDFRSNHWSEIDINSYNHPPSGRSSLVAQVYKNYLYVFAGYNGTSVMNDMYKCRLRPICVPPSSLVDDFRRLLRNDPDTADVCFLIEGRKVHGHRAVLGVRSRYFRAMFFNGHTCESKSSNNTSSNTNNSNNNNNNEIPIPGVSYATFRKVMDFLYTDTLGGDDDENDDNLSPELALSILIASELFMLERLKAKCEDILRREINLDNATCILLAAHRHNAPGLKEIALEFFVNNLNTRSIQSRLNNNNNNNDLKSEPDLLLDIIKAISFRSSSITTTTNETQATTSTSTTTSTSSTTNVTHREENRTSQQRWQRQLSFSGRQVPPYGGFAF
eukprot:jgi/Psemu1/196219/e_gw1.183.83.1